MSFRAASLKDKVQNWQKIDAPDYIIRWISEGVTLPFSSLPENFELNNRPVSLSQALFIDKEIVKLSESGAIQAVSYKPKCISPIGVVPKDLTLTGLFMFCEGLTAALLFQNTSRKISERFEILFPMEIG